VEIILLGEKRLFTQETKHIEDRAGKAGVAVFSSDPASQFFALYSNEYGMESVFGWAGESKRLAKW